MQHCKHNCGVVGVSSSLFPFRRFVTVLHDVMGPNFVSFLFNFTSDLKHFSCSTAFSTGRILNGYLILIIFNVDILNPVLDFVCF